MEFLISLNRLLLFWFPLWLVSPHIALILLLFFSSVLIALIHGFVSVSTRSIWLPLALLPSDGWSRGELYYCCPPAVSGEANGKCRGGSFLRPSRVFDLIIEIAYVHLIGKVYALNS